MVRLVLATIAALLSAAPAALAANASVVATNFQFTSADVTIAPGEKVTWTNPQSGLHNVHFEDGQFDVPATPATSWPAVERTFAQAGTYRYFCEQHGAANGGGMAGIVRVQEPPKTFTFVGGNAAWSEAANWTPAGGPPGPNDTAIINDGTALLSGTASVATLSLGANGARGGSGTLTVANGGVWTGNLTGGKTVVGANASVSFTGRLGGNGVASELENLGTLTTNGITFGDDADVLDPAVLDNHATLTVGGDLLDRSNGGARIDNPGGLAGTADASVQPPLSNSGTVTVSGGILALAGGSAVPNGGDWAAASSAKLLFQNGTYTMQNGAHVTGAGTVELSGSVATTTVTLPALSDTAWAVTGKTLLTAGRLTLDQDGSTGAFDTSENALRDGAGTLTVTGGTETWTSARFAGTGTTVAQGTTTLDGTLKLDGGAILRLAGPSTLTGTQMTGTSRLQVAGSAAAADDSFIRMAGSPAVQVMPGGTLTTSGVTAMQTRFNNDGSVVVGEGALSLTDGATTDWTGDVAVSDGTTLIFGGPTFRLGSGAGITGAGLVRVFSGTLETLAGSTLSPATLQLVGTLTHGGAGTVGTLVLDGGRRDGAGTLTVSGALQQEPASTFTFGGTGLTVVQPASVFAADAITVEQGTLRFAGGLTRTGGSFGVAGTLESGGTLSLSPGVVSGTGVLRLLAGGTFAVPAAATAVLPPFDSLGDLTLNGTLDGDLTISGGTLRGNGEVTGALRLNAGTLQIGVRSPTDFDALTAASTVLGGALQVSAGYTPASTDTWRIVDGGPATGAFASVTPGFAATADSSGVLLKVKPPDPDPTVEPTVAPTTAPTAAPTAAPIATPTPAPTATPLPKFSTLLKLSSCKRRALRVQLRGQAASVKVLQGRRTLKKSSRAFTLKRLPKRAFTLKFEITLKDKRVVKGSKKFRSCR